MTIKAIFFDMDGVLVDAKEWHYDALNRALKLFGLSISKYDHIVTYDGLPTKKKLEMLTMERGLPTGLHEFINEMKQIYTMELIHQKCRPVFHHQYALSRLKEDGFKLAVCSNSIRKTVETMMEKAGLNAFLEFFLSNQDVKHAKPHPEMYVKAMKKIRVKPHECLVLEDNKLGVLAAKESGAHVLCIHSVENVTYENIKKTIVEIEGKKSHG